jgi:hypothetical protein
MLDASMLLIAWNSYGGSSKKEKYVFALHFDHRLFLPVLGLDYSRSPLLSCRVMFYFLG